VGGWCGRELLDVGAHVQCFDGLTDCTEILH